MKDIIEDERRNVWEWEVKNFWHVYSNGECSDLLFHQEENLIFSMNQLAILTHERGIDVLEFSFMDTHFHLILHGEEALVKSFMAYYKRALTLFLKMHKNQFNFGYDLIVSIKSLSNLGLVREALTYVRRNGMDAEKRYVAWDYAGGTGDIFFRKELRHGHRLDEIEARRLKNMFKTHKDLPREWEFDDKGKILPQCYVNIGLVEKVFMSPRVYLWAMGRKTDQMAYGLNIDAKKSMSLTDLEVACDYHCRKIFGCGLKDANATKRLSLASYMIGRCGFPNCKSLARALRLSSQSLDSLM